MNLEKIESFPTREEIQAVLEIARNNPEDLDGRDLWIAKTFLEEEVIE